MTKGGVRMLQNFRCVNSVAMSAWLMLLGLLLSTAAFATQYVTDQRAVGSAGDGQTACTALAASGVQNTCSTTGEVFGRSCKGCGFQGQEAGTLYCAVQENRWNSVSLGQACSSLTRITTIALIYGSTACPSGTVFSGPNGNDCVPQAAVQAAADAQKSLGLNNPGAACAAGNPCNAGSGNKVQTEVDFAGGPGIPSFVRTYNSMDLTDGTGLGVGWTHNHAQRIVIKAGPTVLAVREGGQVLTFTKVGTAWTSDADVTHLLQQDSGGYTLSMQDGSKEHYTVDGIMDSATAANGWVTTYGHTGNQLTTITGPFGHRLTLGWVSGQIGRLTMPDGRMVNYSVGSTSGNLVTASEPDYNTRQYLYEDTTFKHALTGIVDENTVRLSTYGYDAATGKAILTEHAGGAGHYALSYGSGSTSFTDGDGYTKTAYFSSVLGMNRLTGVASAAEASQWSQSFDANGNVVSHTDEAGSTSAFAYDTLNRLTSRTDGAGTALARTIGVTYADAWRNLVASVTEPSVVNGQSKTTVFTYGDTRWPNLPTHVTVSGLNASGGAVQQDLALSYTANAQLATITGPGVGQTTTLDWWVCTIGGKCGQLKSVTNALGQTTTFDAYDNAGRLTSERSTAGLVKTYAYNLRGSLVSVTETPPTGSAQTTTMSYDAAQHLVGTVLPDGRTLTYAVDPDGKVLSITDNGGNAQSFSYDYRGNLVVDAVRDSAQTLARQTQYAFDAHSRLTSLSAAGSITSTVFSPAGDLTSIVDPNGHASSRQYDALHRVAQVVDALGGATGSSYSRGGALANLSTPNGAAFGFDVDDLGHVTQERNPDRGAVNSTNDAAGNVLSSTDARGVTATYAYDALNRLTSVSYPDPSENVTLTYDTCPGGLGLLCSVTDGSGTRGFEYDGYARPSKTVWTASSALGGVTYATTYAWTVSDQISSITYPTGTVVTYGYDALARVASVTAGGAAIVNSRTYRADGLLAGQTLGNGVAESRIYDTAGQLTTLQIGSSQTRSYGRDASGNITSLVAGGVTRGFGYDALDRLTSEPGQSFAWDGNGNRLSDAAGSYGYTGNSNRMATAPPGTVTLDAAGNLTATSAGRSYAYNQAGHLVQATQGSTSLGAYVYRFDGMRAAKQAGGGTTLFHYDLDGNLIAETTVAGVKAREYVHVDSVPAAQVESSGTTWLHTDHLGTARVGTNSAGAAVWQWDGTAFGAGAPSGTAIVSLRLPGQYFDPESGLHQNGWRTYDSTGGRYLESDPIGFAGGVNTYAYANGNPLSYADPTGEFGIAGALWGAGVDLSVQLLLNGGQLRCVNWKDVGMSAAAGALGAGLLNGIGKLKKGSSTWSATTKWLRGRSGPGGAFAPKAGQQYHHWLVEQNSAIGKLVPDAIKNQPWNLNPIPRATHELIHGNAPGGASYGAVLRWWKGTPGWAKGVEVGTGIAVLGPGDRSDTCGCN